MVNSLVVKEGILLTLAMTLPSGPLLWQAVPGGIRTPNLLIRSQLLYPVALQTHLFLPPSFAEQRRPCKLPRPGKSTLSEVSVPQSREHEHSHSAFPRFIFGDVTDAEHEVEANNLRAGAGGRLWSEPGASV